MGGLFSKIGNPILVIGHTDATPFRMQGHSMRSNWHLSNERAMAAKQSLHMGGLSTDSVLQVVGMADRAPLDTDNPRAAMNRRIEFLILTRRRAVAIEQMFGAPSQVVPLIDGVNAVAADSAEGRALQAEAS
ncbi:MAG: OmpA family protein [Rhodanobacter sp.]